MKLMKHYSARPSMPGLLQVKMKQSSDLHLLKKDHLSEMEQANCQSYYRNYAIPTDQGDLEGGGGQPTCRIDTGDAKPTRVCMMSPLNCTIVFGNC